MAVPNDPFILVSYVNTLLRDEYASPAEMCRARDMDLEKLTEKLRSVGFEYDEVRNQFR